MVDFLYLFSSINFHLNSSIYCLSVFPSFIFLASKDLTLALWTAHTHTEAPQSLCKGFCSKSFNSNIRYLTSFLMTFAFKLLFHCTVLSLQMANKPFSPSGAYTADIFVLKVQWRENNGEFNFYLSLSFFPLFYTFSSFIPFPLRVLVCQLSFPWVLNCVVPEFSFLVIIQKG